MNNEQDIFMKLVEKAKTAKLTERERATLFLAVDTYVKNNKLKWLRPMESPFAPFAINGVRSFVSSWHIHSLRTAIVALVLVIFGAGGTSLAAQNSLPGDFFYPIRVNVNEEIRAVFLSGSARSEYEVVRAKKRVEEAKELIVQNKMSPEIQKKIVMKLNSHISRVQKDIDALTQKGELKTAFEISSDLETSLVEGETSVSELPQDEVSDEELASINDIIRGPRKASIMSREKTESQILTLQANDENTRAIAEAKFEAVKKILQTIEDGILFGQKKLIDTGAEAGTKFKTETEIEAETKTEIETKIETDAEFETEIEVEIKSEIETGAEVQTDMDFDQLKRVRELLKKGEEKLISMEYNQAFTLFKEAYELAQAIQLGLQLENNDIHNELDGVVLDLDSSDFDLNDSFDDNFYADEKSVLEMDTEQENEKDMLITP